MKRESPSYGPVHELAIYYHVEKWDGLLMVRALKIETNHDALVATDLGPSLPPSDNWPCGEHLHDHSCYVSDPICLLPSFFPI